jgi:hypothetical protein
MVRQATIIEPATNQITMAESIRGSFLQPSKPISVQKAGPAGRTERLERLCLI